MSWSIQIERLPIQEALSQIRQHPNLPDDMRLYIIQGLRGMEMYYENTPGLHVSVKGHGHLGDEAYPITTATLSIERVV